MKVIAADDEKRESTTPLLKQLVRHSAHPLNNAVGSAFIDNPPHVRYSAADE